MYFSNLRAWCVQRVANLGLMAVVVLMVLAFWYDRPPVGRADKEWEEGRKGPVGPGQNQHHIHHRDEISAWQLVFVYYTLFVHVLGLLFPMRLVWATRSMIANLRKTNTTPQFISRAASSHPPKSRSSSVYDDSVSSGECSGYESDVELSLASSTESEWEDEPLLHAIIIPNYKEELDTLRETLDIFASHSQASSSYEIYLAMEQGESGCEAKATVLINEYIKRFRSIEYTVHPRDIPGEAQGKSSNLCWAAKFINAKYAEEVLKRNIIVTVIDSDSHLSSRYFSLINSLHFIHPETSNTTMYIPPIIFDRNAHTVPRLVRVADLLWAGAGLSGHYSTSSICPPTSVYSLPLSLVDLAGGWDAGEEAIGEDLHMYIKCFFALNGNLTTRSVFSPASHSNVSADVKGKGLGGWIADVRARYKQAMRHMWGALDSGFVVKSIGEMVSRRKKDGNLLRPNWMNVMVLIHRMYEAHFLPIHVTLLIIGGGLYTLFTPTNTVPRLLLQTLDITGYLRFVSALNFIYFFFLYESLHYTCVKGREEEMLRVGMADGMVDGFSYRSWRATGLDFTLFPVAGIVFGTVPAVIALCWQFWSLNLVYKVSRKPSRTIALD